MAPGMALRLGALGGAKAAAEAGAWFDFQSGFAWLHGVAGDMASLVTCARASPALFHGSDLAWRSFGNNVLRRSDLGILREEARTNKCRNFNANPDGALTNITQSGDVAAILTEVDDVAALLAGGLLGLCTSGKVFRLDNSAGSSNAFAVMAGNAGNINIHTVSAFVRGAGTGIVDIHVGTGPTASVPLTSFYQRISATAAISNSTACLRVRAPAGTVVYFILTQYEEAISPSSPIVVAGAAASRAADSITVPLGPWFNQNEGTFLAWVRPAPGAAVGNSSAAVVSVFSEGSGNRATLSLDNNVSFAGTPRADLVSNGATASSATNTADAFAIGSIARKKIAMRYALNSLAVSTDGGAARTQGTAPLPLLAMETLAIGHFAGTGVNPFAGMSQIIERIAYFPRAFTNAELQYLSTVA
jgi:hypothetical protein